MPTGATVVRRAFRRQCRALTLVPWLVCSDQFAHGSSPSGSDRSGSRPSAVQFFGGRSIPALALLCSVLQGVRGLGVLGAAMCNRDAFDAFQPHMGGRARSSRRAVSEDRLAGVGQRVAPLLVEALATHPS